MRTAFFGILAATGIAFTVPANAQGVYVGAGPVGVGVGVHHEHNWHRDYGREDRVVVREGHRHCKTVIIHEHGLTKKIRHCH